MTILKTAAVAAAVALMAAGQLVASPMTGIYAIVERIVFEPDAAAPERAQIWGIFAYVDAEAPVDGGIAGLSPAERGYHYFRLPDVSERIATRGEVAQVTREWAEIAAMAGTGQAVVFGRWAYAGTATQLRPDARNDGIPYLFDLYEGPGGRRLTDVRVRPAAEAPTAPAPYVTRWSAGTVKLSDRGIHAAIVAHLRAMLETTAQE